MTITSIIEYVFNQTKCSVVPQITFLVHYKDYFAYGKTASEAINSIFNSINN